MVMSRSESHQRQKEKRSKRLRRLIVVNLAMLVLIGVLIVVYLVQHQNSGSKLDASQNAAPDSTLDGNKPPAGDEAGAAASVGNQSHGNQGDSSQNDGAGIGSQSTGSPGTANAGGGQDEGTAAGSSGSGETENAASAVGVGKDEDATAASGEHQVNLSFTGDILLAASVEKLLLANGYDYPYAKVRQYLQLSDVTAANLETPVTLRGTPAPDKQYVYKSSPDALPALVDSGVDVVSLANNHTLDQGEEGLMDTIDYLNKAKLPYMGAGINDTEAFKPVIKEVNGTRVAYIGLTRVVPVASWKADKNHPGLAESYDTTRAVAAIKKAKTEADIVVVMVHWGTELQDMPNADQTRLGHTYIDAGADLVVGSHPHILEGFESYKGKWIAYSLGNFIFSGMPDARTADTGVLDAACAAGGKCSLMFHPMRAVQSQPAPLEGEEAAALLKRLSGLSIHAAVDSQGRVQSKE